MILTIWMCILLLRFFFPFCITNITPCFPSLQKKPQNLFCLCSLSLKPLKDSTFFIKLFHIILNPYQLLNCYSICIVLIRIHWCCHITILGGKKSPPNIEKKSSVSWELCVWQYDIYNKYDCYYSNRLKLYSSFKPFSNFSFVLAKAHRK